MKKLIIAALCLISISATAQTVTATDTVTNAGTSNLTSPAAYFQVSEGTWAASFVGTKITGTTAGYAILQTSVDGTNFTNLYGDSRDSFAVANVAGAQVKNWYVSGVKPKTVRVHFVGSGTQTTQVKSYFIKNSN